MSTVLKFFQANWLPLAVIVVLSILIFNCFSSKTQVENFFAQDPVCKGKDDNDNDECNAISDETDCNTNALCEYTAPDSPDSTVTTTVVAGDTEDEDPCEDITQDYLDDPSTIPKAKRPDAIKCAKWFQSEVENLK